MPLLVNLRHLEAHNLRLQGELPVAELDLDTSDELVRAKGPLRYEFEAQMLEQSILVQGRLQLTLHCQCARCLRPVEYGIDLKHWTRHMPLEGEEAVAVVNDCVDLTACVREDILLEFPQHPLCKTDCGGLTGAHSGKAKEVSDLKPGPQESSAWAELDKLKL